MNRSLPSALKAPSVASLRGLAAVVLVAAAGSALAQHDERLLACRKIADPAQRVACYDQIPVGSAAAASPGGEAQFGLEARRAVDAPDVIRSRVLGAFDGWGPNQSFRLENGQIWAVTDDSRAFLDLKDPVVTVRRGALGAFYLEIEGTNRSPKVRRIR